MPDSIVAERRRFARRPVRIAVTVKNASGLRQKGVITDISEGGCAFTAERIGYERGAIYTLRTPGLEALAGWAEWICRESAGLAFDRQLHPSVVDHLAQTHPAPLPVEPERKRVEAE